MRMFGLRAMAAGLLLAELWGCSAMPQGGKSGGSSGSSDKPQEQSGQGGGAKAQSAGGSSTLDQELKRQADIYKELLKHNTERAKQDLEADRKLLEGMQKGGRQTQQNQGQSGGKGKSGQSGGEGGSGGGSGAGNEGGSGGSSGSSPGK